ncbi:CLUMA_CG010115, isoform A [Clunio marinus]|uniref:CLUMA_CG010115, isoform A n=1 Tax=Clunio marinus TaxID=568069 RepID=A0A1J1IAT4_9DIPT|nr:CLUMA_CG010115, isoform A [Clunio marinus]
MFSATYALTQSMFLLKGNSQKLRKKGREENGEKRLIQFHDKNLRVRLKFMDAQCFLCLDPLELILSPTEQKITVDIFWHAQFNCLVYIYL